ncbi:hypothetical protein [Hyphococcus sp.]|uniref:hypothetical protein n=1 Tax=Hyphococcus sp. TaxID=2038636 RepID=UPI003CCB8CCF
MMKLCAHNIVSFVLGVAALVLGPTPGYATQNLDAEKMGASLLDAMGGRDVWSVVRTVHNTAINHHPQARLPYIQEYWFDVEEPAQYLKRDSFDMEIRRAYTISGGWEKSGDDLDRYSEERLESALNGWEKSLYRKFYLLAKRPDALELVKAEDGMLEFYLDTEFLGWMMIDEDGAPQRHGGTQSREQYFYFDELAAFGPINWPHSGGNLGGWKFEILSIELLGTPAPVSFAPPSAQ